MDVDATSARIRNQRSQSIAVGSCSSERSEKITSFRPALCLWSHESGAAAKLEMHQSRRLVRGSYSTESNRIVSYRIRADWIDGAGAGAKPDFLKLLLLIVMLVWCGQARVFFSLQPESTITISGISEVADCGSSTCRCSSGSAGRSSRR